MAIWFPEVSQPQKTPENLIKPHKTSEASTHGNLSHFCLKPNQKITFGNLWKPLETSITNEIFRKKSCRYIAGRKKKRLIYLIDTDTMARAAHLWPVYGSDRVSEGFSHQCIIIH